jgi:DNA-directed RNA polymerase subunit RPC12/RpoP
MASAGVAPSIVMAHRCPYCRACDADRVPRAGIRDSVARVLGRRVYRCGRCGGRFYDLPTRRPHP